MVEGTAPTSNVIPACAGKAIIEACAYTQRGFLGPGTKAERERHLLGLGKIDFADQRHIAILSARPVWIELARTRQELPAVRPPTEACAGVSPRHRAAQRHRRAAPLGKQERYALIFAQPSRIACAGVDEVRRQQGEDPIAASALRERFERRALQNDIPKRIANDLLGDAIMPGMGVHQLVGRDAIRQRSDLMIGVSLLLGKEALVIDDDE